MTNDIEIHEASKAEIEELVVPGFTSRYLAMVCYGGAFWAVGPCDESRENVINSLANYSGVKKVKLFRLTHLPIQLTES